AAKPQNRIRFGLRTLVLAVGLVAVATWFVRIAYEWQTTIPLAESVATFNETASKDRVGMHEPPITEDEIFTAIKSALPNIKASDQVKAIYSRIVRTRRLPNSSSLNSISGYSPVSGENQQVWWINLDVMTEPSSGYALRIRETSNPVAADAATQ
ncbi:hypothetical protein N9L06_06990, partial [Mariniblastus sp.]|nr:hypothetical protein [Mariniblastus sp.]